MRIIAAAAALLLGASLAPPPVAADAPRRVVSVYDGDTLRTLEDGSVRLSGIDAPELGHRARCPAEDVAARKARDYLRARTAKGVVLRQTPGERDREKYGRLLRRAYALDGGDLAAELIARGLAAPYGGKGPRMDWCKPR